MSLRALEQGYKPTPHDGHGDHAVQVVFPQYEDIDQQNESYIVGMWTFLVTEIMFFGALFLAYSLYRVLYFEAYLDAHQFLNVFWGTLNTGVLLSSSFSMATAVWAAQQGRSKKNLLLGCLIFTNVCAFGFLGIKYIEYTNKIHEGLFPGSGWNYAKALRMHAEAHGKPAPTGLATTGGQAGMRGGNQGVAGREEEGAVLTHAAAAAATGAPLATFNPAPRVGMNAYVTPVPNTIGQPSLSPEAQREETRSRRAKLFFSIYFIMTGLHGIHVLVGILIMTILGIMIWRDHPQVQDYMPTELVGLYWHFVDIVWIFLFPLMYLIS
jgi:cytochrome c oxidase subunit III